MGHYCWMCGKVRPNEAFSGRGHRRHLCKRCARRPRAERERIQATRDLQGYLAQKRISGENIARLRALCESDDEGIQHAARLILEVALIKPHKRGRTRYLRENRPDLLARLLEECLFLPWGEWPASPRSDRWREDRESHGASRDEDWLPLDPLDQIGDENLAYRPEENDIPF